MFCPTCGTLNEDGVPFCGGCGAKLMAQQQAVQQPVYQQPTYQQPAYQPPVYQPYWQPMQPAYQPPLPGKGMGVAGMILGIAAVSFGVVWFLSAICAVLAIIFSAISQSKARRVGRNNGMAIAGLICGGIGLAIAVIAASVAFEMVGAVSENFIDPGLDYTYRA